MMYMLKIYLLVFLFVFGLAGLAILGFWVWNGAKEFAAALWAGPRRTRRTLPNVG